MRETNSRATAKRELLLIITTNGERELLFCADALLRKIDVKRGRGSASFGPGALADSALFLGLA